MTTTDHGMAPGDDDREPRAAAPGSAAPDAAAAGALPGGAGHSAAGTEAPDGVFFAGAPATPWKPQHRYDRFAKFVLTMRANLIAALQDALPESILAEVDLAGAAAAMSPARPGDLVAMVRLCCARYRWGRTLANWRAQSQGAGR